MKHITPALFKKKTKETVDDNESSSAKEATEDEMSDDASGSLWLSGLKVLLPSCISVLSRS